MIHLPSACNERSLHGRLFFVVLAVASLPQTTWIAIGAEPSGAVIRLGSENQILVEPVVAADGTLRAQGPGLVVWGNSRGDFIRGMDASEQSLGIDDPRLSPLQGGVRGDASTTATFHASRRMPLEQLLGRRIVRGAGLLTPAADAELLDGRVVFRRAPLNAKEPPRAAEYRLLSADRPLGIVRFAAEATRVDLADVIDLPADLRNGLPPGEYSLHPRQGAATSFRVASSEHPAARKLQKLSESCRARDGELYAFSAVYFLVSQRNARGVPQPFLADALRIIEEVPLKRRPGGLTRLHDEIVAGLLGETLTKASDVKPIGIGIIDEARSELAVGRWSSAAELLASAAKSDDERTRRLSALYQAVLLTESGSARSAEAAETFQRAADALVGATDEFATADRFRVHNNFANFLAEQALNRLHNQSFQAATGMSGPLTAGLITWCTALEEYEAALNSASSPSERAAVQVNMAQLYSLLADMIRSLDGAADSTITAKLIDRATTEAARLTKQAEAEETIETDVQAAAKLLLAELAFRADDAGALNLHVTEARKLFLELGSPVGLECVERMSGLFAAREARQNAARRGPAMEHLTVAQFLAEALRAELPADRVGLARAGFLARRVYVNERLIELLLAEGRVVEALIAAEAGKARAMNDVLGGRALHAGAVADSVAEDDSLANWPRGIVALEYFLGADRAWVFVVSEDAKVSAFELQDVQGTPLPTGPLVARVSHLLTGMKLQARQMLNRLNATNDYDQTWQNDLDDLRRLVLPEAALMELRKAKTALVVPHHVLHYVPFAALVTQRDERKRGPREMVAPRFLLDEAFDIAYAPSLQAWRNLRRLELPPISEVRAAGIADFRDPSTSNLPGVADDLKNLRAAFGERVRKVLVDAEVRKAPTLRALESPGLLLLSTHGANLADQPLRSFLRIMPDETGDKYLTAEEIYAADVGADLIVLSACFSGLADRSPLPSDDLFGLQRAFLHAGARCVVSGMWDVFDSTGVELMQSYFVHVARGAASPNALAKSQRDFLNKYRRANDAAARTGDGEPFIHPYFWAVYTSTGDDRAGSDSPP